MTRPHGVPHRPKPTRPGSTFLTVPECAVELRLSADTLYRAIHRGELRALRIGRQFRVEESALDAFVRGAGQWSEEEG